MSELIWFTVGFVTVLVTITAAAVLENVKLGRMTSSPGFRSHSSAAISNAVVPEVVSKTFWAQNRSSSHRLHFFVN